MLTFKDGGSKEGARKEIALSLSGRLRVLRTSHLGGKGFAFRSSPDAVRGFIFDVATGLLEEVN